jgi:hypothetical protein
MPQEQFAGWLRDWQAPDLAHESVETVMAGLE